MRWLPFLSILVILIFIGNGITGSYKESAHGNTNYGAKRSSISRYSRGLCVHCHEMHASIGGKEPEPSSSLGAFILLSINFDNSINIRPDTGYNETHDFCFYCHGPNSLQDGGITNYDYSKTFGGAPENVNATNIMDAFNQASYHNLYDIWDFAKDYFSSFFTLDSNPCVACHNPHIAKRNKANPGDPTFTAISRPTNHGNLWGDADNETMYYYNTRGYIYQAPYRYSGGCEPDGGDCNDLINQAKKTPNYVTFCQDCHSKDMSKYGLSHTPIDWEKNVHGERDSWSSNDTDERKAPYNATANYILSCTDCHEPHGSPNFKYLIRREVNGEIVTINSDNDWDSLCSKCHTTNHHSNETCIDCHYHEATDYKTGNPIF